jgi:hypothetical protein
MIDQLVDFGADFSISEDGVIKRGPKDNLLESIGTKNTLMVYIV